MHDMMAYGRRPRLGHNSRYDTVPHIPHNKLQKSRTVVGAALVMHYYCATFRYGQYSTAQVTVTYSSNTYYLLGELRPTGHPSIHSIFLPEIILLALLYHVRAERAGVRRSILFF